MTAKDLPGSEPDVAYTYDLLGRMTGASQTGNSLSFTYDALSRNLTQVGPQGTVTSTWDIGGRRTRIAHPDGFYVDQDYLVTGEMSAIRENGATSGAGVLATYAWDDLGRRSSLTRGDGSVLSYGYDAVSRLTSLADNLVGTTYDQTLGFGYTPASQIASNTRSNDSYAWNGHYNLNRSYTSNGRNQYAATGSITPTYDGKGNLTSAGSTTYAYSSENLLTSASGSIALTYDPALRLYQTSGGSAGTTRLAYDGTDLIAEYNSSNAMLRRYVHGPGADEPLVWYEGSGTTDRRFLHADERASIVAVTNSSGTTLSVNTYDEYGIPGSGNAGRFQYTGQAWLPELGMYYYKARIYSPTLGRFLQTDPIGYGDGMNMYAYVGGDPVNGTDPTGTMVFHNDREEPRDNEEEWLPGKGVNLITLAGGHSRDGMGSSDLVRMAGGLLETLAFERALAQNSPPPPPKKPSASAAAPVPIPDPPSNLPGGPYEKKPPTPGNRPGSFQGPAQPKGPRSQAQWVPPESQGGPEGSKGYWKVQAPGEDWNRYTQKGQPITPQQAHPNPPDSPTRIFFFLGPIGAFICLLFCEGRAN